MKARTKDPEYQICRKTVMDTSDPHIKFDADGVSNHVHDFEKLSKLHWFPNEIGEKILRRRVQMIKARSRGAEYDCILGLSGGLDSSYMLHKLVVSYGLRPLVFHVDGGWNTDTAVHNIEALVDGLSLDLITEVIDWDEMREFQLAMFMAGVPHLDIPQDMAFISVLYKFAQKYDIKTILNGGNFSTESVLMPLDFLYWGSDLVHVRDILNKHSGYSFKRYPFTNIWHHKFYLRFIKKVDVFKPLNLLRYEQQAAISELQSIYNWRPYRQKHFESRFTRFFEGYWLPTRFNYDMRRNQFSSLILTGQMSREDALTKLNEPPLEENEIARDKEFIAAKLEISLSELEDLHCLPKKFYWDYKNRSRLFAFGEKTLDILVGARRGGAI